ncbi:membrane lipoprotein [Streptomyces herbicida]|uniref:membrane lipoprotein n=1 Tax=Streptomyces herbicida TaxID=3065675 RepID=UPI002931CF24|nr:membrane lipoprotein [Streptomyces sp. NEAU-HV9]
MIRTVRALTPLLLLPVLLTACGTEKAGTGAGTSGTPDTSELDARVRALGVAPELVYVTKASGFTPAQQSVGVNGDDGFSVSYWSKDGGVLHLYSDRGTVTAAVCPKEEECVAPKKGQVVHISGEKVSREVLREAARSVYRPSAKELAALLPSPAPTPTEPVRRGDLPSYGDGAPDNSVGEGG